MQSGEDEKGEQKLPSKSQKRAVQFKYLICDRNEQINRQMQRSEGRRQGVQR